MRFLKKIIFLSALSGLGVSGFAHGQQIENTSHFIRKNPPIVIPATPYCPVPTTPTTPTTEPKTTEPTTPPSTSPEQQTPPDFSAFTQPSPGGTAGLTSGGTDRPMIGDLGGTCSNRIIFVPRNATFTTTTTTFTVLGGSIIPLGVTTTTGSTTVVTPLSVCDPVTVRAGSGFKISDNASPRPEDRFFCSYNYFHNLNGGLSTTTGGSASGAEGFSTTTVRTVTFPPPGGGGQTPNSQIISTTTTAPPIAATESGASSVLLRNVNLHRELIGFEKTFWNGNASVGVRLPFFQTDGGFGGNDIGDVSVVTKFALYNNRDTGDVFSVGLVITAPTGPGIDTLQGKIDDWLLQPWGGWIINPAKGLYLLGFHAIVVPTDSRDVTVLFNDLGVGYNVFANSGGFITSITPTAEVHVTTPLNNRGDNELISVSDIVSFTLGTHFGIGQRSLLTLGVNVPVTGPQQYDIEALVNFNFRF